MIQSPQNRVTVKVQFSAAHHIPGDPIYGNNHGHNWNAIIRVDRIQAGGGEIPPTWKLRTAASQYDNDDVEAVVGIGCRASHGASGVACEKSRDAPDLFDRHQLMIRRALARLFQKLVEAIYP